MTVAGDDGFVGPGSAKPLRIAPVDVAVDTDIACLSSDGSLLVFPAAEIKKLSVGGRGVTLIALAPDATLVAALPVGAKGLVVSGRTPRGKDQQIRIGGATLEEYRGKRARKGRKLASRLLAPVLTKPEDAKR